MKSRAFLNLTLIAVFSLLILEGCSGNKNGPRTFDNQINPRLKFNPTPMRKNLPLGLVIGRKIPDQVTIVRAEGQVTVNIHNFRAGLETILTEAFSSNFSKVAQVPEGSRAGLVLLLSDAQVGENRDTLRYRVQLTYNGANVHGFGGQMKAVTRMVPKNGLNWKDLTAKLTTDYLEQNISKLAEEVHYRLLVSEDTARFWAGIR